MNYWNLSNIPTETLKILGIFGILGVMQIHRLDLTVDNDPRLGYEINGPFKKALNILLIPILNNIPSGFREFIKKTHHSAKKVIEKATTHEAIEVLYKNGEPEKAKNILQRFFYYIWFSTDNPKAIRNRLRLVERELRNAINKHITDGRDISILSIASGSSRAILDSLDSTHINGKNVLITFLDKSPAANKYSKKLTLGRNYPSNYQFRWVKNTASKFPLYYQGILLPNIVEIVGLFDYFQDRGILRLFSLVHKYLPEGGTFITSNIVDNPERKFVTDVVGWKMIYRNPEDFYKLAIKAGFDSNKVKFFYEPLKIHFVMVAEK